MPTGITSGPDTNLWFTESGFNDIGQITTGGGFTFFATGITAGATPDSITSGPAGDNDLWFTEVNGNRIGRITTAGVITEFSVGLTPGFDPDSITLGPDGNLWFVGIGSSMIGRITPKGVITEFPGETGQDFTSITAGPDGDLWFTEQSSNKIGKIDPMTFQVTEYTDPTIISPTAIITGPDGNLWFTGGNGLPRVDRITTSGAVTSLFVGLTLNSDLRGIATGPDGNLYFDESAGDRIGQLILPGTSVNATAISPQTATINQSFFSQQILTFTDKSSLATPTNFQAHIDYGDGTSQDVSIDIFNGDFVVNAEHTYQSVGAFDGSVTIFNSAGATAPIPFVFNVVTSLQVRGLNVNATANRTFTDPVANFNDSVGLLPTDSYRITINWGDNTTSSGTVVAAIDPTLGFVYDAIGTHTYASAGSFPITTTVQVISQPSNTSSVVSQAIVTPSTLSASGITIYATENNTFNGVVAGFTDTAPASNNPVYTALINWGDGTPDTSGTISLSPNNGAVFGQVIGNHVYTKLGSFQVTVEVTNTITTDMATAFSTALVSVAGPSNEVPLAAGSSPNSITSGPDGNLWFTDTGNHAIGRITTGGVVTEFTQGLPANVTPNIITAGPDGNLWFTENGISAIGRITLQGVITEFSQGLSSFAQPFGITAGPDGNLWFTDESGAIGRITPQGVITEFSQGIPSGATPIAITMGPDGALWFTEDSLNDDIGRITTQGVITNFPLTSITSALTSITTGPDGALWFTEETAGMIGRITTSGVVTSFSTGLPQGSQPYWITPGPDGNLWFVDIATNNVDRITTSGVITVFGISTTDSMPRSIVTGPDKNLWFTESNTAKIGQFVLPQSVISTPTTLNATANQPLTTTYATFRDLSTLVDLTRFFTSAISFGDNTSSTATLTPNGSGGFAADATHTYMTSGMFQGSGTLTSIIGTSSPSVLFVSVGASQVLSFVVVNANDSGPGSLRQAILNADTIPGKTITFAIPFSGVITIALTSPLPAITVPTTIDGTSQSIFQGSAPALSADRSGRTEGQRDGGRSTLHRVRDWQHRQGSLDLRLRRASDRTRFGWRFHRGELSSVSAPMAPFPRPSRAEEACSPRRRSRRPPAIRGWVSWSSAPTPSSAALPLVRPT